MATVIGGLHQGVPADVHAQIAAAVHDQWSGAGSTADQTGPTGGPVLPDPSSAFAFAHRFDTVSGDGGFGFDTVGAGGGHDTVPSAPHDTVSGFDTVTGPGHDTASFAGDVHGTVETVVATQTVHDGGVTVHFTDGSALTVAGVTRVDGSFFHGH